MAVRFDAVNDRFERSADVIDYNAAYCWMGWFYIAVDANAITGFALIDDGSTNNRDWLSTTNTGTLLRNHVTVGGVATNVNGTDLSTATWHHLAMVRESTTSLKVYLNGALDSTNTADVSARGASSHMEVASRNAGASNNLNGRTYAMKAWANSLTLAEVQQEMNVIRPVRSADLYAFWPIFPDSGERVRDYGGVGRDWTEGGTVTDEDPPPISWGSPAFWFPFTAAGGTQYNQSADGTLTTAGALMLQTATSKAGTLTTAGSITKQDATSKAATLTTAGSLTKQDQTAKAATLTTAGGLTKQAGQVLTGVVTSAASLARQTSHGLTSSLATAATIAKRTAHGLAAALASSGATAGAKVTLASLVGTLTSAGALATQHIVGTVQQVLTFFLGSDVVYDQDGSTGTVTGGTVIAPPPTRGATGTITGGTAQAADATLDASGATGTAAGGTTQPQDETLDASGATGTITGGTVLPSENI